MVITSYANTPPSWFLKLHVNSNQIIGYGAGNDLKKAKKYALEEIANSISTKIESYLITYKKYDSKNGLSKQQESFFKQSTNVTIEDITVLKSSYLNNKWYIALGYDYTPFAVKFKELLINEKLKNETQNSYLSQTNLIKNLNNIIGYKLNYKIYNKEGIWYLNYKDKTMKISPLDFENLFSFINSNIIELDTDKNSYLNNESISFNITSKKAGYISLLYLGTDGQVGVIAKNIAIKNKITYPKNGKIILKKKSLKNVKFMIFALFSNKKVSLKKYETADKKETKNKDFKFLIKDLNKYEYTTYVGNIKN